MDDGLTIQQVAQRTGLSHHTLRYYERLGLLISVHRLPNGQRRYDEGDLRWIELLKCLRAVAVPCRVISAKRCISLTGNPAHAGAPGYKNCPLTRCCSRAGARDRKGGSETLGFLERVGLSS